MRIYISGPITGIEDYEKTFMAAVDSLLAAGFTDLINPALNKAIMEATYEDYMDMSYMQIDKSDLLVLLSGWEKSIGARREVEYALRKNKGAIPIQMFMQIAGEKSPKCNTYCRRLKPSFKKYGIVLFKILEAIML